MTSKTTNRFANLSRSLLQDALLELLKSKSYPKITVTDIVKKAELSRPTFYAHFETKDNLLMSYVDDLLDDIYKMIAEKNEPTGNALTPDIMPIDGSLFDVWLERKEVFEQIRSADIDYLIFKKIRDHHYEIFSDLPSAGPMDNINPTLQGYCINYMAGSVAMFILHWIDQGMPHKPEDLGELLQALNARDFPLIQGKLNKVIT